MRFTIHPAHFTDTTPREAVAAFNSLALATQWAKNSAELEGRGWTYDVYVDGKQTLIYHSCGMIDAVANGLVVA